MIDGAIFSGLAQMGAPGYLDGHQGVWMVPEETLRAYWRDLSGERGFSSMPTQTVMPPWIAFCD
jgi:hypothetical protein